jgi:ADP-ribosylation factor family
LDGKGTTSQLFFFTDAEPLYVIFLILLDGRDIFYVLSGFTLQCSLFEKKNQAKGTLQICLFFRTKTSIWFIGDTYYYFLFMYLFVMQDLPGALDDAAITESLELHKIKNRQWAIFKTSAIKGEGIFEGLDW